MEFDAIPDALQTRLRVAILAALYGGEKDFNTLRDVLSATDGNLSVQLSNLIQYGCLRAEKLFDGPRRRTVYSLTEQGARIFCEYVEMLRRATDADLS